LLSFLTIQRAAAERHQRFVDRKRREAIEPQKEADHGSACGTSNSAMVVLFAIIGGLLALASFISGWPWNHLG